jgi:hypothetical protein
MAQARLIVRRPKVFYRPASAGGVGAWTDLSGFFKSVEMMAKREVIDTSGYGTLGKRIDKGDPADQVKLSAYHSRLWSEFSSLMATELNSDDATEWMVKYRGADATAADNPYFRWSTMMTDFGNLGGNQNTASMFDITLDIQGRFQISTTAGDPPADNTFTDYI